MRCTLLLLVLAGCGAPAPAPEPAPAIPTPEPVIAAKPTVAEVPPPPVVAKVPTPLPMPTDLGGHKVSQTLMTGATVAEVPPGKIVPKPYTSDLDSGDLPLPPIPLTMPILAMPSSPPIRITPPPEVAPRDLGGGQTPKFLPIQANPRPLVKAPSVPNPGAADVPSMARQLPDRASVEDPSAEFSNSKVIVTKFPLPMDPLPFLKFTIPNPFEFLEQLKGKLPREQEFDTAPAVMIPEKR